MTTEDVQEAIIKPMLMAFPPPTHLRGNRYAIAETLNTYRRALSRFERPVLELAWQKAAAEAEYRIWPSCPAIVKAAEHFNARLHPPPKNPDAWVDKAQVMASDHAKKFMKTSQAAVRARAGGYQAELKQYVEAVAWVQSQLLLGRRGLAYTSTVLFQNGEGPEERESWFDKIHEQVASGTIRVHVPSALVRRWKEQAKKTERIR